eukprot:COSAG02_NODE_64976_length_259_cov_0.643750_1_plen_20_part_01
MTAYNADPGSTNEESLTKKS